MTNLNIRIIGTGFIGTILARKQKSLPREEMRQAFNRTEQRQGGGASPFPQAPPGGVGRLHHEAMREELHCFDT
ncbi:hypothetical protein [Rhizobium mesoamericanum]|uniref:hypothetical protein n=1 Tax=Rhizobium mesoamericanum TaxID=1079800 RepID=UPI000407D8A1|nr:hypothetical protein [Rhizobium mesoamericanum]